MKKRFRGFLPVVVDVETAGLNPKKDALLEVAAVLITMDEQALLSPQKTIAHHIEPFPQANLDQKSLDFNKIDPFHPFRFAIPELQALQKIFDEINQAITKQQCQRAVLVGHNAWFDLLFIKEAAKRCQIKKIPFHAFTCFDTATLSGLIYGQTVLAKAMAAAGLPFNPDEAHSAIYDAEKTAELFCCMVNHWQALNTRNLDEL